MNDYIIIFYYTIFLKNMPFSIIMKCYLYKKIRVLQFINTILMLSLLLAFQGIFLLFHLLD